MWISAECWSNFDILTNLFYRAIWKWCYAISYRIIRVRGWKNVERIVWKREVFEEIWVGESKTKKRTGGEEKICI